MSRLLLVGWDAADWKIIDPLLARGEMPREQPTGGLFHLRDRLAADIGKDQRRIEVSEMMSAVKDTSGKVVGAVAVTRDISGRRYIDVSR